MHVVDAHARDAIRRHQSALFAYFTYRVESIEDAADLFSETALVAWRRRRTMPAHDDEAKRWLYGVAQHSVQSSPSWSPSKQTSGDSSR
ncbi:RNA polymerase sigma factor [Rhodoglobus vestalii]|uniref:RNA polymerase sigma factor n=1 Tax=Rhodoglobus vestalii TaxID=193384 RepID=UPI001152311E|nr:sigma factor [Rhodoglobus vestalii]